MAKPIRHTVHAALKGVDAMLGKMLPALATGETLSQDEALTRYVMTQRGNPRAIGDFAAKYAPPGLDPMRAAYDYERDMEKALAERTKKR